MGAISLGRSFPALYVRPLTSLSDERLASLVNGGNDEAFEILFQRYRAPLSRYCRSIVRDPEDAHDAHQTTMLAALRALRDRRLSGRVKPWLYRIAHNESISVLRRRRDHEQLDEQTPSARGDLERLEQWEVLISDLRTLPERQRGALLMRELGGLEYHEIGVALEMSAIRARKVVFEARSALSDNAAGRDADCAEVRLKLSDGDGRALRGRRLKGHLEACTPCAAFALKVSDRRRALALIPAGPMMPIGGGLGGGLGIAAGGVGGSGIAAGGVAIGTGSAGLAAKGIASAVCALCAIAGAGAILNTGQHRRPVSKPTASVARARVITHRHVSDTTGPRPSNRPHQPSHAAAATSRSAGGQRVAAAPVARIGPPQQRVGRPPAAKLAPVTPPSRTLPTSSPSAPTSSTPVTAPPTTAAPTTAAAAAPQTGLGQWIQQLIQNALAASSSMSPAQQSQLAAVEQQWHAAGSSAPGFSSSVYTSLQSLMSRIAGGSGAGGSDTTSGSGVPSGTSAASSSDSHLSTGAGNYTAPSSGG